MKHIIPLLKSDPSLAVKLLNNLAPVHIPNPISHNLNAVLYFSGSPLYATNAVNYDLMGFSSLRSQGT